jgi:hypothetical protein
MEQSRLAASIVAHQSHNLTSANLQIYIAKHSSLAIGLPEVLHSEQRLAKAVKRSVAVWELIQDLLFESGTADRPIVRERTPVKMDHPFQCMAKTPWFMFQYQECQPTIRIPHPRHKLDKFTGGTRIKIGCRFIQNHEIRFHGQHCSEGNFLLLSSRKLSQLAPPKMRYSCRCQRPVKAAFDLIRRTTEILGPKCNLILHAHGAELPFRVLLHKAHMLCNPVNAGFSLINAANPYAACYFSPNGMRNKSCQAERQCRLATAARASHNDALARFNYEVNIF